MRSPSPASCSRSRSSGTSTSQSVTGSCHERPSRAQASAGLVHHVGRAPAHRGKQCGLRRPHADERIAAVLCRNDYRVGAAAQDVRRAAQVVGGERGAIGADDQARSVRRRDRREHARAEIAVTLARERDAARAHRLERRMRLVGRGPQRHRADGGGACGGDCACDQPRLQRGGAVGAEHRDEPRLGEARNRRLGQYRDGDRLIA